MKPFLFLLLGLVIIWAGATGRLGLFLAALFTPTQVITNNPNLPTNGGFTSNAGGR